MVSTFNKMDNCILYIYLYVYCIILLLGLNSCGIDCDFLFGQGYDGAANMAGRFKGAQTVIRSKHPKAL